jgi:hypothetical protein
MGRGNSREGAGGGGGGAGESARPCAPWVVSWHIVPHHAGVTVPRRLRSAPADSPDARSRSVCTAHGSSGRWSQRQCEQRTRETTRRRAGGRRVWALRLRGGASGGRRRASCD